MTRTPAAVAEARAAGAPTPDLAGKWRWAISFLLLSAWCGLVAGMLEVTAIVLRKRLFDFNHIYGMSRHFIWLIPVSNLCVFLVLGGLGCILALVWAQQGRWLSVRLLCAVTLLPMALVAFSKIYGLALVAVGMGVAARLVPLLERHADVFRRFVLVSSPLALGTVLLFWASLWVPDLIKQSQSAAAPIPPPQSPSVVLIVMDTVAARHLSLHGYDRATSTTLVELAEHGIRFDHAHAAAPWTLPSHAAMFTGRWMHELGVGWLTPLDDKHPTLAEFLGARGYATAGFVANTSYCGRDSGLGRGFTQYHDFIFPELAAFRIAALVRRALEGTQSIVTFLEDSLGLTWPRPYVQHLWRRFDVDRKTAVIVNHEFLDWLARRTQPQRPFFAFLNYYDAHVPYELPLGSYHRFGGEPKDSRQRALIEHWWDLDKKSLSLQDLAFAASAYDDCIADLDEQIGTLIDQLQQRDILDRTWLIIASDHGESFGEHAGVFCHGTSLYQTELHVPLLIIPPRGAAAKRIITEAVSLRDVAATIVDVAGQAAGSPFPGRSLTRFWTGPIATSPSVRESFGPALAEVVPNPNGPSNRDSHGSRKLTLPLGAIKDGEWSYIRREVDLHEELFHLRVDPNEEHNLAADPAARPTLERMRSALGQMTGGPLLPARFSR